MELYKLTEEHRAQLKPHADKWTKIILHCGPMSDDEKAQCSHAAHKMYELIGKKPRHVVFAPSPLAASFGAVITQNLLEKSGSLDVIVPDFAADYDKSSLHEDSIYSGINIPALARYIRRVGLDPKKIEMDYNAYTGGSQYAQYDCYLTFFRDVARLDLSHGIDYTNYNYYETLARLSGPRMMYEDFCIISDMHVELHLDEAGLPHCATGPYIRWADGTGIHAWHGTYIPAKWTEIGLPTAKELLQWPNTEQRRAGCDMLGWHKILDELDAVLIDANSNPEIGTLYQVDLPDSNNEKFLRVHCGTKREYALNVDESCTTALQAWNWLHSFDLDRPYQIEVRT